MTSATPRAVVRRRVRDGTRTTSGPTAGFPNLLYIYGHKALAFCNGPTCAELQRLVVQCLSTAKNGSPGSRPRTSGAGVA